MNENDVTGSGTPDPTPDEGISAGAPDGGAASAGTATAGTPEFMVVGHEKIKERGWFTGRAGLLIPLIVLGFATYLLVGQLTMKVPDDVDKPGPQFFPALVITAMYVLGIIHTIALIRTPHPPEPAALVDEAEVDKEHGWYSDWSRVAWALGGLIVFIALLVPAGWIIAAAVLFWCITRAMNSPRPLFDISIALVFSSAIYLIFAVLLSVNLPSGWFGSLFGGAS